MSSPPVHLKAGGRYQRTTRKSNLCSLERCRFLASKKNKCAALLHRHLHNLPRPLHSHSPVAEPDRNAELLVFIWVVLITRSLLSFLRRGSDMSEKFFIFAQFVFVFAKSAWVGLCSFTAVLVRSRSNRHMSDRFAKPHLLHRACVGDIV